MGISTHRGRLGAPGADCQTGPLTSAAMTPVIDPQKMSRLAFIRLLYLQAHEQSGQPSPLAAASVLAFHDAIELFLVLAVEHANAGPVKVQGGPMKYWEHLLKPTQSHPGGIKLSGQIAMGRLNALQNNLKHAGGIPSAEQVADAAADAASFFENNTPTVFGIDFAAIDMADVVPQEDTRAKLKAAGAAESTGDRTEGHHAHGFLHLGGRRGDIFELVAQFLAGVLDSPRVVAAHVAGHRLLPLPAVSAAHPACPRNRRVQARRQARGLRAEPRRV
jgi:hypothetical protein